MEQTKVLLAYAQRQKHKPRLQSPIKSSQSARNDIGRSSFIVRPTTSENISPQTYTLPNQQLFSQNRNTASNIEFKKYETRRFIDDVILNAPQTEPANYNIVIKDNKESIHINNNNRVDRKYLQNLGYSGYPGIDYYNIQTKPTRNISPSFNKSERFKSPSKRKATGFIGPGSYNLRKFY
ncbi:hypothetical protein SS50377_22483 [Spironucleus salmonicida]|uniref:Uncharacterized protein n=1 Tax=Spironucleus salmonicida TaxID=348837 RepID=V6LEA4_9EUKA|nr:hypothetical protein SS50377_22483 [Spironucleus salmonicida]|eukprot:EST42026.1 Hypothetical protein SS50377_18333 [Spironucleus salmonicida]